MEIELPRHLSIKEKIGKDFIYQLAFDKEDVEATIENYESERNIGKVIIVDEERILVTKNKNWLAINEFDKVIYAKDIDNLDNLEWIKHPKFNECYEVDEVLESWRNTFTYKAEDKDRHIEGLRSPQIGGVHAALGHWNVTNKLATLVMPTGTGKTETMLSLMIAGNCSSLLVVVPTDPLRSQIAEKFLTLGLLKTFGIIGKDAKLPVVGILKHKPKTAEDIDSFFDRCNVVVTTMSIAGRLELVLQNKLAEKCSHLFVDEAHHIAAKTWKSFRDAFSKKKVLQFTATPFRNDDKIVDGKIIFNYPLSKAQEEGYFKPINCITVEEYNSEEYDIRIAEKAIEILKSDLEKGYNHILMARVSSIERANKVFEIYSQYSDLYPVQIHSGLSVADRIENKNKLLSFESKIVVCVDMLGEGFDLPELKVAAFHDIRKSLPITLQLAGRFTRTSRDSLLGEASIVINIANIEVGKELDELYAQDSNWNLLLPLLSENATKKQEDFYSFISGFNKFPNEIPLQNVRPALSTVIYKTKTTTWIPNNFKEGIIGIDNYEQIYSDINSEARTLVLVTGKRNSVKWGKIKDMYSLDWTLYVIYWNETQQLLFVNCSANGSTFKELANAITFENAVLISAEEVYKSMGKISRLRLNNIGLGEQYGKQKSHTMHTGQDIEPALSEAQYRNKIKTNMFGSGYENGKQVSVGCSYKGRVWSRQNGNVEEFTKWCNHIGAKMLDSTISSDDVLSGAIHFKTLTLRPNKYPVSIEWNEDILKRNEETLYVVSKDIKYPIDFVDISLLDASIDEVLRFEVKSVDFKSEYEIRFENNEYNIENISNPLIIKMGGKENSDINYFSQYSPIIRFIDGSWMEGNQYANFTYEGSPYSSENIVIWDWVGVNIRSESQGPLKKNDSIQYKVINDLCASDYNIVFDDDNAGESADIVTVKVNNEEKSILIELYHLKFSHGDNPGARISDLYEVCGQAQKSVRWKGKDNTSIFKHLIKREGKRLIDGKNSRLEKGTIRELSLIKEKSRNNYSCDYKILIVQPGLSVSRVSEQQLELLAVTENYLKETYQIAMVVVGSE